MHSPWENIYEGTDTRFDAILFGCALAIMANPRFHDRVGWLAKHANSMAAVGAAVIVLTFAYRNQIFRDTIRYSLQSIALMPVFFLITLPRENIVTRFLEWRVLRHLGRLSYSMYLIHHTLFHHFYHYRRPGLLLACVIFLLSFGYAQAMRTLIELPIQRAQGCRAKEKGRAGVVPIDARPKSTRPKRVASAI